MDFLFNETTGEVAPFTHNVGYSGLEVYVDFAPENQEYLRQLKVTEGYGIIVWFHKSKKNNWVKISIAANPVTTLGKYITHKDLVGLVVVKSSADYILDQDRAKVLINLFREKITNKSISILATTYTNTVKDNLDEEELVEYDKEISSVIHAVEDDGRVFNLINQSSVEDQINSVLKSGIETVNIGDVQFTVRTELVKEDADELALKTVAVTASLGKTKLLYASTQLALNSGEASEGVEETY